MVLENTEENKLIENNPKYCVGVMPKWRSPLQFSCIDKTMVVPLWPNMYPFAQMKSMNKEHRLLAANEPVKFEKQTG